MKVAMITSILSVIILADFVCCSAATPPETFSAPKQVGSIECVLCEFVLRELDHVVTENQTEEEIIQLVDNICSVLPSSIKGECQDFIIDYGKLIISALINGVPPSAVCGLIKLCSSSVKEVKSDFPHGKIECEVCLFVAKYLDEHLDENSTIEDIVRLTEEVCNVIPSDLKSECTELLNSFGFEIVQQILSKITPKEICSVLKICSSSAHKFADKLMGRNKCSLGPPYWCFSRETAMECNAEKYCENQKLF